MASQDGYQFFTHDPGAYNLTPFGTAAGTTTISYTPAFLSHVQVTAPAAGSVVIYDSAGTSGTIIGTIVSSTTPMPVQLFKGRTNNGLTIAYSGGVAGVVASLS